MKLRIRKIRQPLSGLFRSDVLRRQIGDEIKMLLPAIIDEIEPSPIMSRITRTMPTEQVVAKEKRA